jgi:hypothetical protein
LGRLLTEIQAVREKLVVDFEQAKPVLRAARTNGGGREANALLDSVHRLNARLHAIVDLGVQVKDLDRGLVDFPAWREDREVFLCWHLGEREVAYWHDLESGFSGRLPLDDE